MRLTRLFLDQPLSVGATLDLDERAHRHAVQVLRLRPGSELVLFNGTGGEYRARLLEAGRRRSRVTITDFEARDTRPVVHITLVQGVAKGDRMNFSLQKATELGVSVIRPVITKRSQIPGDPRRLENRHAHWQGVIISACEQCGRNDLPALQPVSTLEHWIGERPEGYGLLLDPQAESRLSADSPQAPVQLLIGPEGGLDDTEIALARSHGMHPVSLGPRILRTETAGIAALAVIQALWGDLKAVASGK